MDANEYQRLAMRTCSFNKESNVEQEKMIMHGVMGLNSEAGEVAGIFQKVYQGHDLDYDHIKKELGDALWFIAELCEAFGFSMSDVMATNVNKLLLRYPDGFKAERSLCRAEGDI